MGIYLALPWLIVIGFSQLRTEPRRGLHLLPLQPNLSGSQVTKSFICQKARQLVQLQLLTV